jgi:hypothetical protein
VPKIKTIASHQLKLNPKGKKASFGYYALTMMPSMTRAAKRFDKEASLYSIRVCFNFLFKLLCYA